MDAYPLAASLFMLPIITLILMSFFSGEPRKPREPRPTNRWDNPRAPPRGYGYSYAQDPRVQAQWGPSQKAQSRGQSQKELCEICGKRPKYVEWNGLVHPYCGRTCARASRPDCKYPACNDPGKSTFSGYCGPQHARDAVREGHAQPCTDCKKQPQAIDDLCLACHSSFGRSSDPRLKELSLDDPKAVSVIDNFYHQWKGSEPAKIGKLFEIRLPTHVAQRREAYQSKISAVKQSRQLQTFHSTQCICDLGTDSSDFCDWQACGICAIITNAFSTFEFGVKSNSGGLGNGVYSYLDPALADRWALSTTSSPYRVMIGCEVNVLPPRQKPPMFSGLCQSREEGSTVLVSGPEAITPKYLILYSKSKHPAAQQKGSPTVSIGRNSVQE